ncbi:MAG: hypothetical protein HZA81_02055 [Candidatus Taylorbacteria bacterium]|nr:hypothetical protein [Candidatus Taylorbacteria bacterium]
MPDTPASPSPSLLDSLWNLVKFFVFPILAFIWAKRCKEYGSTRAPTFVAIGVLGSVSIAALAYLPVHALRYESDAAVYGEIAALATYLFLLVRCVLNISDVMSKEKARA